MKLRLIVAFFTFYVFANLNLHAQESINPNGQTINSAAGSVSYTIGQIDYIVWINGNEVSEEGVQHPMETYFVTGVHENVIADLNVDVYPIPTSDFIHIRFSNTELGGLSYKLYDLKGGILFQKSNCSLIETIDLKSLSSSTYLIKTWLDSRELKTFQIIKK